MTKSERSAKTKDRIIESAGELAALKGLDGVTLRDITKRSGDNLGSITYHFQTKENLLIAVAKTAISGGRYATLEYDLSALDNPDLSSEDLIQLFRSIIRHYIEEAFREDRPDWYQKVIHQLVIRRDELHAIYERELIEPKQKIYRALFKAANPNCTPEQVLTRSLFIRMPFVSYMTEQKMILRRLGVSAYTKAHLRELEDLMVRQAAMLMGLSDEPQRVRIDSCDQSPILKTRSSNPWLAIQGDDGRGRPLSQAERSEQTRARIIESAGELASELGLDGITLRDVVKRSGDNLGGIHYHFKTKEILLREVVETAIAGGQYDVPSYDQSALDKKDVQPEEIVDIVRTITRYHLRRAFGGERPEWCHNVVHQLLIREDELHEIYEQSVIDQKMRLYEPLFKAVDPTITPGEVLTRSYFIRMPFVVHMTESKMILRRLGLSEYTEEYLKGLEDLMVRQAVMMLELPAKLAI